MFPREPRATALPVAELKAILDTLPDDMAILVNHERFRLHTPELFVMDGDEDYSPYLVIVPAETATHQDAIEKPHWRHIPIPASE